MTAHSAQHGHTCSQHQGPCPTLRPQLSRRSFAKGLLASASAAALAACATSPVTGRRSLGSIEQDVSIGQQEHPKILEAFGGEYRDGKAAGYVQQIGQKVAQQSEYTNIAYHFTVLNSPIVNAFALPGGYIYVTRGLMALASTEAEVAGVLGHEMGHVTARHSAERQTQSMIAQLGLILLGVATESPQLVDLASVGAQAFLQSYSRDQELEADTLGVRYMTQSGYDPEGMVTFLASLREYSQLEAMMSGRDPSVVDETNMMATHPRTIDRVQQAMDAANAQRQPDAIVGRDQQLAAIDGMLYGDDPAQGVVDGQQFRHPGLRVAFTAPNGFRLLNGATEVTAQHPKGAAFIFDMAQSSSSDLGRYITDEWAKGTAVENLERITVNGIPGVTGTARMQTQSGAVDLRPVALQADGNRVYRFLFITPTNQTSNFDRPFRDALYSFRRLNQTEAQQIRAFYVDIVTVRASDTVAGLSRTMPFGRFNEQAFRVLNDIAGGEPLPVGEPVKIVVS